MLPPLSYSAAEIKAMNLQGHSLHASPPEWGSIVGVAPCLVDDDESPIVLPPELATGFDDGDIDTLGNWLRNAAARSEATAADAARAVPADQARRAAAVAALPGRAATRGAIRVYYGQAGALGNRFGAKFKMLRVRQRLVHTVRAVLRGRDWRKLPRGQLDLRLLRSA